jgi:hypothetical protein
MVQRSPMMSSVRAMEQRMEYFLATGWSSGRSRAVVTTINKVTTVNKFNLKPRKMAENATP